MVELIAAAQIETDEAVSEEPVIRILRATYPDALIGLHSSKAGHIEVEGRDPVSLSELADGLWEDTDYLDDFIATSNHLPLPTDRVVRVIAAQCESVSGKSFLAVGIKDFRLVFDDIDAWFVQTCAGIISQMWQKRLLAEVMVAKEKFLRGFSHQLRTPIHGILGSVELLAEELKSRGLDDTVTRATALLQATPGSKPDEEHRIYLDTIKRAGRDLISIINSMITLNRWADVAITERQYATYTTYELETELANETQKAIIGDARYNASIVFNHNLPPDHCSLRTDLGLLRDSLLPLIINAVQSTAEGIVVVTISICPDRRELIVDVKDTGHGIPVADQHRIFELYEQVDAYSTGAGLGLTIATKFAALLEGSVDLVSSEIDCGSHFRATFHNVELTYSESPVGAAPVVPQLANLPRQFHIASSNSKALSLSKPFTESLTCYGWTSSDNTKDAIIILDFVAEPEQHRAALLRLPPDEVVICLVPFAEGETHLDDTFENVVYVNAPFLTETMSSALEQADKLISLVKNKQVDPGQATQDPGTSTCNGRTKDAFPSASSAGSRDAKHASADQPSNTDEAAHQPGTMPEDSNPFQPGRINGSSTAKDLTLVDSSRLGSTKLPMSSTNNGLADIDLDISTLAIAGTDQVALVEAHSTQSAPTFPEPSATSQPTALLVDDNTINLRVMQMYCDKRKLPYLCAKDGLEAVSIFHEHQKLAAAKKTTSPIQVILMDLQMPGCDGIEATRRIRQLEEENAWGKSVLFIVTGQDSRADRDAARDAGSQEYYVKPLGIKVLDLVLKRYFPRFEARNGVR